MSTQVTLMRRLARRLAGQCCYGACQVAALADGDYCAPHDAHEKGRARAKARRRRLRLGAAGICIMDGCGSRVGKRPGGGKPYRRCLSCAREDRVAKSRVPVAIARVPDNTPRTKLEIHSDGYVRVRTIGRGVRGQKSRIDLDDDLRDDLRYALADVKAVHDSGIAALRSDQVVSMGGLHKREACAIVADRLLKAARTLVSVADALCAGRSRELQSAIAEAATDPE